MTEKTPLDKKIGYVDKTHIKVGTENANAVLLVKHVRASIQELKEKLMERCEEIKLWEADALMRIYDEEINKIFGKLADKEEKSK